MHHRAKRIGRLLLLTAITLFPALSWALPEDAQQPVSISADNARFDEKAGEAVYRGSVVVIQGTLKVQGDTLTLRIDDQGALTTARTLGKPARYQQRTDPAKGLVNATADEIQFDHRTGTLVLIGNALLKQDGASFSGPRIVYSTEKKQIEASGNSEQRVHLVFPPQARGEKKPAKDKTASPSGAAASGAAP
ncbi:MAG: lipopolysaccharide transport periplasmic protein LptA [Paraperlucidibaca sp.]